MVSIINNYANAGRRLVSRLKRGDTRATLREMAARGWKSTGNGVWTLGRLEVDGIWTPGKHGYQVIACWDGNQWLWFVGHGPSCPSRTVDEGSSDRLLLAAEVAEQANIDRVISDLLLLDNQNEIVRLEALLDRKRTFYVDRYIDQIFANDPALNDFRHNQGDPTERLAAVRLAYVRHEVRTAPNAYLVPHKSVSAVRTSVGKNWVWFGPAAALVLLFSETHTIGFAWTVGKVALHRWNWGGLLSPSADFCWLVTLCSMILPVQGVVTAKKVLGTRTQSSMFLFRTLLLLLFVLVSPC